MTPITTRTQLIAVEARITEIGTIRDMGNLSDEELDILEAELAGYVKALDSAYLRARKRELGIKVISGGIK